MAKKQKKKVKKLAWVRQLPFIAVLAAAVFITYIATAIFDIDLRSALTAIKTSSRSTIIILEEHSNQDQEDIYVAMQNSKTNIALRSPYYNKDDGMLQRWENVGRSYYYTVASSDYVSYPEFNGAPTSGRTAYVPQSHGDEVLRRDKSDGIYIHELVSLYAEGSAAAGIPSHGWSGAVNKLDWNKLDHWVKTAKEQRKKVIWSEPAYGWEELGKNATAQAYFKKWKSTLVPMFGTNYVAQGTAPVDRAFSGANSVASKYRMSLGESVQTWYFKDQGQPISAAGVIDLFNYGADRGVSYYQVEGEGHDMRWETEYIAGVASFVQPRPSASLRARISSQPRISRVPLYQMWNNKAEITDHYYTADQKTRQAALEAGYIDQGIIGYVATEKSDATVPLYEMYSSHNTDHFYTAKSKERKAALKAGWKNKAKYGSKGYRIVGYVPKSAIAGTTPVYQLWSDGTKSNPGLADHFYTTDRNQRNALLANQDRNYLHYVDQGIVGFVYNSPR